MWGGVGTSESTKRWIIPSESLGSQEGEKRSDRELVPACCRRNQAEGRFILQTLSGTLPFPQAHPGIHEEVVGQFVPCFHVPDGHDRRE